MVTGEPTYWKVDPDSTHSHWLQLANEHDTGPEWEAFAKLDGCVQISSPTGSLENEYDIHVDDLDELIDRLIELRTMARAHFGTDWPY